MTMQNSLQNRWYGGLLAPALVSQPVGIELNGAWAVDAALDGAGVVAVQIATALAQHGLYNETLPALPGGWMAAAVATLPLSLFYYEQPTQQQAALAMALKSLPLTSAEQDGILAFGRAIAHLLQATPVLADLLPQVQATATPPPLAILLQQTHTLVQERASLQRAIATLMAPALDPSHDLAPLALALYCFLSAPWDGRLAILRAGRCPQGHGTALLTSVLVGVYHGSVGIPLLWQLPRGRSLPWGLSDLELASLTQRLFSRWAGAFAEELHGEAIRAV
jgi:hypothetical protein